MKPGVLAILSTFVFLFGVTIGRLIFARPDLTAPLGASEARAAALARQVQDLTDNETGFKSEIATLRSKLSAVRSEARTRTTANTPARAAATLGPSPTGEAKPFETLSKMMQDPAMRAMARQQQVAMQEMQYADLYPLFRFNDDDKAYFKQLLAERAGIVADMGLRLMDPTLTPTARTAIADEGNQQKEVNNQQIRKFLDSDADFNTFQHYEDTKTERMLLSMNKAAFAAAPLTPQQETQLIDTMHQFGRQAGAAPDRQRPENFDLGKFGQEEIDQQLQKLDRDAQSVRAAAAQFLSPQQIEALEQAQANLRAMTSTSLNMMKSMSGGAK